MKIGDDGFTKIFEGDKLRSTQHHPSANFIESDLVFKKSLSVTKYTQPEPEAKKICQNFTLNSSVDRLQHEAGNRITD